MVGQMWAKEGHLELGLTGRACSTYRMTGGLSLEAIVMMSGGFQSGVSQWENVFCIVLTALTVRAKF